jgi:putative Holliday junction resolvase
MSAMRFLGVDPGGQRLGLAVADDTTGLATPLEVIAYRGVDPAADEIAEAARSRSIRCVVVGLPTTADGDETPACRRSHALAGALQHRGLEVVLQPEHLSSSEARRRAREAGMNRRRPVDHLAAAVILEDFLAGGG